MIHHIDTNKFFTRKRFSFKNYIPHFIRNVWYFRKELNEFRSWDWTYNIMMFRRSLELLQTTLENGYEVDHTRLSKVEAIKETISVLKDIEEGTHLDRAFTSMNITDEQLSYLPTYIYQKMMERSMEIEQKDWDRLVELIRNNEKGLLTWWD